MSSEQNREISSFIFEENIESVAENLIGAILITETGRFRIEEVKQFYANQITAENYQLAKYSPPGTLTGSPYRRTVFANISVSGNGLIMPTRISIVGEDTRIEGPGKVSKALGIGKNESFKLEIVDPILPTLHLTTTIPEELGRDLKSL